MILLPMDRGYLPAPHCSERGRAGRRVVGRPGRGRYVQNRRWTDGTDGADAEMQRWWGGGSPSAPHLRQRVPGLWTAVRRGRFYLRYLPYLRHLRFCRPLPEPRRPFTATLLAVPAFEPQMGRRAQIVGTRLRRAEMSDGDPEYGRNGRRDWCGRIRPICGSAAEDGCGAAHIGRQRGKGYGR